jgi:putative ABC transport system permease protein
MAEVMKERNTTTRSRNRSRVMARQVVLPFKKSLEISFKSIRIRFSRSLITTFSLVLAVSFLSFISVSTDVANGLLSKNDPMLHK